MRISDWSSDVCSSDLGILRRSIIDHQHRQRHFAIGQRPAMNSWPDRKSVVSGKSVSVRVDLGGRRIIKKKRRLPYTYIVDIYTTKHNSCYYTPVSNYVSTYHTL